MSNPTKEERASKLFEEGEKIILAGGGSREYPTQEAVAQEIGQAQAVAWALGYECGHDETLKDVQKRAEENEALERDPIPTAEVPRRQTSKDPIQVSILMKVDQGETKSSLVLYDSMDVEGLEFQEAVHIFGEWFQRMQNSLHAIGPRPIPLPEHKF